MEGNKSLQGLAGFICEKCFEKNIGKKIFDTYGRTISIEEQNTSMDNCILCQENSSKQLSFLLLVYSAKKQLHFHIECFEKGTGIFFNDQD